MQPKVNENPEVEDVNVFNVSEDSSTFDKMIALIQENVPTHLLIKFSTDEDWALRGMVAVNEATPLAVLDRLASDDNPQVRLNVAKTQATLPSDLIARLADDTWDEVRQEVANRHEFYRSLYPPVFILGKLSSDKSHKVRAAVAENGAATSTILEKLAKNKTPNVLVSLAKNYRLPSHLAVELSSSRYHLVRQSLAANPNIPKPVLSKLAEDKVSAVRLGATNNRSLPFDNLVTLTQDKIDEVQRSARQTWENLTADELNEKLENTEHANLIGLPKAWVQKSFNF